MGSMNWNECITKINNNKQTAAATKEEDIKLKDEEVEVNPGRIKEWRIWLKYIVIMHKILN